MEVTDKALDRIKKLLAKAESTTPEEAEALTAQAERLLAKYQIDRALLNARSTTVKERIELVTIPLEGIYAKAYMNMMYSIVMAYGETRAFYTQWGKSNVTLTIVGFESTVSQLKILLASLQLQAVVALGEWWKTVDAAGYTAMDKFKARRTFIQSFGNGAATRIKKTRASAVKEAESSNPGAELVLVDRKTAVDNFMKEKFSDLKSSKSREKSGGYNASTAGYRAGQQANTGDKQVNVGQRALNG